ncbi:MAG: F0F1 ATP synthase subunit alpha, partial [Candidatus Omnitrophota bacterium]|nr:F0F1 ATP synthase subunit alpha [Candidatus Omnitrophota bacterium]
KDVICVYCCIGKSFSDLLKIIQLLRQSGAHEYTIVVSAIASASTGEQYLAPYTAAALGEYFMDNGRDALVVFDDLTKHAWAYREISLLMDRPPGREAYPGDIYYIHSQLLERAGKLNSELGGGSMTFLPIVETLEGDVTGYIPSNLISMTDGQIYLNSALFSEGFKPAVDLELSVSRIGNKVQSPAMRDLSEMLRLEYIQYKGLKRVTEIRTGISGETEAKLKRGAAIAGLFIQDRNSPVSTEEQIIFLYALAEGMLDDLPKLKLDKFKAEIFSFIFQSNPDLIKEIAQKKELNDSVKNGLNRALGEFFIIEHQSTSGEISKSKNQNAK